MASLFGRKVVAYKTNKSGGGVIKGDVLVPDTSNDNAFTTTTSAASTAGVWIADETIANNATGRVVLEGHVELVNVSASVTRGHTGTTHTVAKQAVSTGGTTRSAGTFCKFTTGGTTPEADIWPVDLLGSSLTNPMTTAGDIIVGGASGAPARLAAGTAGYPLVGGGAGVAPAYQATPTAAKYKRTSGDYTTTSTSYVDVDGTNLALTITTLARRVLVGVVGNCLNSAVDGINFFDIAIDTVRQGTTNNGLMVSRNGGSAGTDLVNMSFTYLSDVLSAASHTFKLQWKVAAGTGTLYGAEPALIFWVQETMSTT